MAKIKYSDEQEPIKKKHFGFTFIKNATNYSMFPAQRNKRTRKTNQLEKMQNLQKAVRFWRTMPGSVKAIWETFATNFPQSSKRLTGIPLTGYQLFIKRNHYCFLNAGLLSDFMEQPELVSLPYGAVVFTLQAGLNSIDLTEIYIKNFGFIPLPGQWLIFAAVPYSEISGQFFPVLYQSIQVLETYIDGFFLNIEMATAQPNIVYSVYLSKPVNPGQNHKSSKVRYMGCFTTKSFLGLSDTPESYAGQAGNIATVNQNENALIFVKPVLQVAINFVDAAMLTFVYNCPSSLVFTAQQSEGADAIISPALLTNLTQYTKVTITAPGIGLIILTGYEL
jgi:hypothetical protein